MTTISVTRERVLGRLVAVVAVTSAAVALTAAGRATSTVEQQASSRPQFGGTYSTLDPRRQALVDDWVARFASATGQSVPPHRLYDEGVSLSTKTTFDAVTHALMTTALTDEAGAALGDALALVRQVDAVHGEIPGAPGDGQFRIYAQLAPNAIATLERARQFRRGADNSIYHRGYPINYRSQDGVPSIQVSIALDERRADIDVDYRSSRFPVALFNGHLTSSNSDVRAGSNYGRHVDRWTGFQNWWRSFFGVRLQNAPEESTTGRLALPTTPRAGRKTIDLMVDDFLRAWLLEANVSAALGYVAEQAYACLALELDDPSSFDRGMAPYTLMARLKASRDALGPPRTTLEGLTTGVRLTIPGLKVVTQPRHAQFVLYAVPDDVAARFDCESRLTLADGASVRRAYGHYYGATFYVAGNGDNTVALLWARVNGYWKIVSWQVGVETSAAPPPPALVPAPRSAEPADRTLVRAAHDFLDRWLVRKDYDAAIRYLSPASYPCYDLVTDPHRPGTTRPDEAGPLLRDALERSGERVGRGRPLTQIVAPLEPHHPDVRPTTHPFADTFTLTSLPTALGRAFDCTARASGAPMPRQYARDYGELYGMHLRFRTRGGEAPAFRLLWGRENGAWRITAFDIENP